MLRKFGQEMRTGKKKKSSTYFQQKLRRNLRGDKKERDTHQLVENRYIVCVREEGSVALRGCGERRSVHSGEDVGECARRTELCPSSGIAGDPLALRRVYRSDVLISQLRERHVGGKKEGKVCCNLTKQWKLPRYPLLQCEHVRNKRCKHGKSIFPREQPV